MPSSKNPMALPTHPLGKGGGIFRILPGGKAVPYVVIGGRNVRFNPKKHEVVRVGYVIVGNRTVPFDPKKHDAPTGYWTQARIRRPKKVPATPAPVVRRQIRIGDRRTILTAGDVREIRRLHAAGQWTTKQLAEHFGTTLSHMGNIVHRRRWRHV